jgi:hypothetical protein
MSKPVRQMDEEIAKCFDSLEPGEFLTVAQIVKQINERGDYEVGSASINLAIMTRKIRGVKFGHKAGVRGCRKI